MSTVAVKVGDVTVRPRSRSDHIPASQSIQSASDNMPEDWQWATGLHRTLAQDSTRKVNNNIGLYSIAECTLNPYCTGEHYSFLDILGQTLIDRIFRLI